MKVLLTSCLASLLCLAGACPSYAADPPAVANFSVERGLAFSLVIDGQPIVASTPQVHLDNLAPGQHTVELAFGTALKGRRRARVQATVWLEEGLETSFVLTQRAGHGWQLRQVSTAALPGYGFEDQPGTYAQPDPNGNTPAYNGPPSGNAPAYPAAYPPVAGPTYPASPAYPSGPAFPASPAYPAPGGYPAPLISSDAAQLVEALKQCSFDDKRLPLFYQAVSRAYIRADDLAAMVHTMTYSASQVQVAEFGYGHLTDPQNFNRVLAALTFSTDASTILNDLNLRR